MSDLDQTTDTGRALAPTKPSFRATLDQLQGGTLEAILTRALADTAMGVAEHATGKQKGKVTLTFEIARGKGPFQLELSHKIVFAHPTVRGRKSEESADATIVFINQRGHVSVVPDGQGKLFE